MIIKSDKMVFLKENAHEICNKYYLNFFIFVFSKLIFSRHYEMYFKEDSLMLFVHFL